MSSVSCVRHSALGGSCRVAFGSITSVLVIWLLAPLGALAASPGSPPPDPGNSWPLITYGGGAQSPTLSASAKRTRFVIGLHKSTDYQVFSLGAPNRVIVDLPVMQVQLPRMLEGKPVGLVKAFRAGLGSRTNTRVVIDVTVPVVVERAAIERDGSGKPRLVLDIVPVEGNRRAELGKRQGLSKLGAGLLQPPLPKRAPSAKSRADSTFKPLIVLDPGHGGHDSGAQKNGAVEKDVVLAFGKVLRERLLASGRYRVKMTRDTDVFIPLDRRVEIGEDAGAALFIAIHADYAAGSDARGATIYSLTEGTARSLARSTKNEVVQEVLSSEELTKVRREAHGSLDVVKNILSDLARRDVETTKARTNLFSRAVIETMSSSTNMRSRPDRQETFRVLQTAKLPSVLIELAYVTNKLDAKLLQSDEWRSKVSASIVKAVDNYFDSGAGRLPM